MQHPFSSLCLLVQVQIFYQKKNIKMLYIKRGLENCVGRALDSWQITFYRGLEVSRRWWKYSSHFLALPMNENRGWLHLFSWRHIIFTATSRDSQWRMTIRRPLLSWSWLQTSPRLVFDCLQNLSHSVSDRSQPARISWQPGAWQTSR